MPTTIRDVEYFTTTESAKYFGNARETFKKLSEKYKLEYRVFEGLGNKKFFKKTDLDKLKADLGR